MATYIVTSATLTGAADLNRVHRTMAQDDVGGKMERMISNVNDMNSTVSVVISSVNDMN